MSSRSSNSSDYRYGFNGQEKDDEISGEGNSYTAEFWQYDPRVARRWNIDPVDKPWMSSYHAFSNNPILKIDPNGAEDTEYIEDGETGEKVEVSDLGGDEVDYVHTEGGEFDGQLEIIDRKTGESTLSAASPFIKDYTHRGKDDNGKEISYLDIYNEFLEGTGPEKSLVYGLKSRMIRDIVLSPQYSFASKEWQNVGNGGKYMFKGEFGLIGAYKAGSNMTAQMIGKASFSFYPVGSTLVVIIVDSKSVSSYSFNPLNKGEANNIPRDVNNSAPQSTTYQTYIFHIPITKDPKKVVK